MQPTETIEVNTKQIACDGDNGSSGHPKIYLTIDDNSDYIDCPYCSRRFLLMHKGNNDK